MTKLLPIVAVAASFTLPCLGQTTADSKKPVESAKQEKAEKAVQITMGPKVQNITGTSATLHWATDTVASNQVKYRSGNGEWKTEYKKEGSKDHYAKLTGLKPNETVEYQILTRDGDVRKSGNFKTAPTATGTMPDVEH
jgi:hypothetical protein